MANIEDDLKNFNIKTLELMDAYKSPKDKKIYNNKIKALCLQYRHLLDSPNQIGPKVREFISYNLNS